MFFILVLSPCLVHTPHGLRTRRQHNKLLAIIIILICLRYRRASTDDPRRDYDDNGDCFLLFNIL